MTRRAKWFVMATALTVLLIGTANIARHVFDPLPSDGVRWDSTRIGLVARSAAQGATLKADDRLRRVDGMVVRTRADLLELDRVAIVGATRAYEIERSGAVLEFDVEVMAGRAPMSYLLLALVGLISLVAAGRIFTAQKESDLDGCPTVVVSTCIALAAMALTSPVGWMDSADALVLSVDLVARSMFAALFVHCALSLTGALIGRRSVLLYLPSSLLILGETSFLAWGSALTVGDAHRVSALLDRCTGMVVAGSLAVGLAVLTYAHLRRRQERSVAPTGIMARLAVGIGPYLLLVAVPSAFGLHSGSMSELSLLPMVLVPLALVRAVAGPIVRLEDLARGGWVVGGSGVLVAALVLAAGAVAGQALPAFGVPAWLGYVAVALLLATGLLDSARTALQSAIEVRLDRRGYEARKGLVELGRELAVERHPADLSRNLLERLRVAFGLSHAALYSAIDGGEALHLMGAIDGWHALPTTVARGAMLDVSGAPVVSPDHAEIPSELVGKGFDVVIPMRARGMTVGLLLMTAGRRPLSRRDRQLVVDLAGYVAIALDHSRLRRESDSQAAAIRELEQFRSNVVESLPMGVLIVDLEGAVLSANRPLSALIGQNVIGRDRGLGTCTTVAELPSVVLDPPAQGRVVQRTMDDRILALTSSLLRRVDGTIQGRVIIVEDVTARVAEERESARRDKLATVGMLSAGIAHEVNTPLTGIASYVQMMLASTSAEDPRRKLLEKAERQAFRAARMVRNFLDYARPGDGGEGAVDLNRVATNAVGLLEHEARRVGVVIELDLDDELGLVNGRDGELEQVALNVIKNALDALEPGGGLHVSTRRVGDEVQLCVEDDGAGMTADVARRIFDPFFSTKHRDTGHGLGLHIVYGIVKAHLGDIRVSSAPGHGSKFEIALPAVSVRAASGGGA